MPDNGTTYTLGDNFDRPVDQREIVDNSFLGLVLFGVKPHDDPTILNSLAVGDAEIESGGMWHRFRFDGYGEQADGGDWDLFFDNADASDPRPAVAAAVRRARRVRADRQARRDTVPATIADTANDGLMLPEQVWDDQPPPGERSGQGTRSATPLAWTHGQFIRLAWSIDAGRPIERPAIVACRYQKHSVAEISRSSKVTSMCAAAVPPRGRGGALEHAPVGGLELAGQRARPQPPGEHDVDLAAISTTWAASRNQDSMPITSAKTP